MVTKSMLARTRELEKRLGVSAGPEPTLFISIGDAGVPDPDDPESRPPIECSDDTTVGYRSMGSPAEGIRRKPLESIFDLKARAMCALPQCRVFLTVYAGDVRTTEAQWLGERAP